MQATSAVLPRVMLGPQLIMVLVYLWSRAYPAANVGFMGVVNFQARASRQSTFFAACLNCSNGSHCLALRLLSHCRLANTYGFLTCMVVSSVRMHCTSSR